LKLQHNYKIENQITLTPSPLSSSSHQYSNGDLHKPKGDPRGKEWLHLGGEELEGRLGFDGEDGAATANGWERERRRWSAAKRSGEKWERGRGSAAKE
jgi:hypothetical protein